MKRLTALLTVITLLLSLAACSAQTQAVTLPSAEAASPSAEQSVMPIAVETESPTDSPSPPPSFIALDTDIPDVIDYVDEISVLSSNPLQEDDNYYYFSPSFSYSEGISYKCIYCISKSDGSIKKVTDRFGVFTAANGVVYYAGAYPDYKVVCSYDSASGEKRNITTLEHGIYQLSYFNGKFYYSFQHASEPDSIDFCGLCSCNPDWSDTQIIAENIGANMFFIYNNELYYELSPDDSSVCIYLCSLDGSDVRQISDVFHYWYEIGVYRGKLFYHDRPSQGNSTFNIKDIDTGKVIQLEDFDNFGILGQYVIFPDYNGFLNAYDITTGKQYKLFELDAGFISTMHTTPYGAYISLDNTEGFYILYKITISDGKASLEKIAEIDEGTGQ